MLDPFIVLFLNKRYQMYVCLGLCLQWWAAHYRITTSMLDHIFEVINTQIINHHHNH